MRSSHSLYLGGISQLVAMMMILWTLCRAGTCAQHVPRSFAMLTSLSAVASTSVPPASPTGLAHSRGGRHALTADRRTSSMCQIRREFVR